MVNNRVGNLVELVPVGKRSHWRYLLQQDSLLAQDGHVFLADKVFCGKNLLSIENAWERFERIFETSKMELKHLRLIKFETFFWRALKHADI